ncbi:MAG: hypothetical protein V4488_16730 [Pseudomonadota bacterium]
MKIDNYVDATLVQLLSALCTRRDIAHTSDKLARMPFDHILGTLARSTMANSIKKDGAAMKRYQFNAQLSERFKDFRMAEDHVFPIHQWKMPLLQAATAGQWKVDADGLRGLRELIDRFYVTARIPVELHQILSRCTMPDDCKIIDSSSIWARYRNTKVCGFIGRELIFPDSKSLNSDFVLISV